MIYLKALNFFKFVVDFLTGIGDFVNTIITSMIDFISYLTISANIPIFLENIVPGIIGTSIMFTFTVGVVKAIFGR